MRGLWCANTHNLVLVLWQWSITNYLTSGKVREVGTCMCVCGLSTMVAFNEPHISYQAWCSTNALIRPHGGLGLTDRVWCPPPPTPPQPPPHHPSQHPNQPSSPLPPSPPFRLTVRKKYPWEKLWIKGLFHPFSQRKRSNGEGQRWSERLNRTKERQKVSEGWMERGQEVEGVRKENQG